MIEKESDKWETPTWLFNELNDEFNFDIDLCATEANSKCSWYGDSYLWDLYQCCGVSGAGGMAATRGYGGNDFLSGKSCFMNPPYSNPLPFVKKAWEDSKHCKIVLLLKCDTSTRTFGVFWQYLAECCENCRGSGSIRIHASAVVRPSPYDHIEKCRACRGAGKLFRGAKPGCEVRFLPKRLKFEHNGVPSRYSANFPNVVVIFDRGGL